MNRLAAFLTIVWVITIFVAYANVLKQREVLDKCRQTIDNSIAFCQDCCWETTMDNRTIYTCADTKEELWQRIP